MAIHTQIVRFGEKYRVYRGAMSNHGGSITSQMRSDISEIVEALDSIME